MQIHKNDVHISRVVGEDEHGITLFVPKSEDGIFHLEGGEKFLTMMFLRSSGDEDGTLEIWTPWEDEEQENG